MLDSDGTVVAKEYKLSSSVPFTIPDLPAGQYILEIYPCYTFGLVRKEPVLISGADVEVKRDIYRDCRDLVTDDIRNEAKTARTIYVWDENNRNGRYTRSTQEEKRQMKQSSRKYKVMFFYLDDALSMPFDMYYAYNWATFEMLTSEYGEEWIEYALPKSMGLKSYVAHLKEL